MHLAQLAGKALATHLVSPYLPLKNLRQPSQLLAPVMAEEEMLAQEKSWQGVSKLTVNW